MSFAWLNEPPLWRESSGLLEVTTGEKTDFWRETHYGFIRDDGHFRHTEVQGDFTASVAFTGRYEALYDQAGMMLRLDERAWIKAGVEFVGGIRMLSAVVTRDFSDWSTMPLPRPIEWVHLRCTRRGSAVQIEWSDGEQPFSLLRLAYLPPSDRVLVGPMCCTPERSGLEVQFRDFEVGPASVDRLHGPV